VLLYELLTGTTPFDKQRLREAAYDEMRRIIREEDPPNPSTRLSTMGEQIATVSALRHTEPKKLSQIVRGELDWIVMKALEKERARRYETANGLAHDVQRYLKDEAVHAFPPSAWYRGRKFCRRNKVALTVFGLVLLFLMLMGSGIGWTLRDRSARQARVREQLGLILDEVARLEQAEKWSEALSSARRAEPALAAGDAAPDIQDRARCALADLELVGRIEEIRAMSGTAWGTWNAHDPSRRIISPLAGQAEQDYAAAFRGAGIDVDVLSSEEAAKRIAKRGVIARAVLPALDDWVAVRSKLKDPSATRRLIDVLRTADPDPWRERVRDCLAHKDWSKLDTLVSSPDLDRQPPATISFVCAAIRQQAEADVACTGGGVGELGNRGFDLEIDILRRAQLNYPADYWINCRLGVTLTFLGSPPAIVQEGMGYLRAAVAIRPQDAQTLLHLAKGYERLEERDHATACYGKALEAAPQDAAVQNSVAWGFATHPDIKMRNPARAVEAAKRAVELSPQAGHIRNTLGVARYRAGEFKEALEDLKISTQLTKGGSGTDFFFLAMANWQLGNTAQARNWYDQGVTWMEKCQPQNEELRGFRSEAEQLLKIPCSNPATKPQ
jgi:tetratricopeptide (TPR) repeat protein